MKNTINLRPFFFLLIMAILIVGAISSSIAQVYTTTNVSGRITLPIDIPAVAAKVILRNIPTGTLYGAVTDSSGFYRIPKVETGGPYELEATLKGYQKAVSKDIYLTLGTGKTINLELSADSAKAKAQKKQKQSKLPLL